MTNLVARGRNIFFNKEKVCPSQFIAYKCYFLFSNSTAVLIIYNLKLLGGLELVAYQQNCKRYVDINLTFDGVFFTLISDGEGGCVHPFF